MTIAEMNAMIQPAPVKKVTPPPTINADLWGEPEQAYYTIRYYNASGIGCQDEMTNVCATSEQEAKDAMQLRNRIAAGNMCRVYAFKQAGRI